MNTKPIRPYARVLDTAPRQKLKLPAHVDGQLDLQPATYFYLGAICGAGGLCTCLALIWLLFF